ncbi:MAG: DUF3501 family protein [Rhodospirillaceae bacterium]|nr:DUF3501 family protein [Rhodospirillaceae bacterium]
MANKTEITRDDIMSPEEYNAVRAERRAAMVEQKKLRRLHVGPHATFYFENWDTMWYQIQEMLRIEKGGEAQLADELEAYNPLVPKGDELVATLMFEIDEPVTRAKLLGGLGGVEDCMTMEIDGETIVGRPEADVERTNEDGKASSIQFVHFQASPEQITKFRTPSARIIVAINHANYGHMTVIPEATRAALAGDFAV